MVCAGYGVAGLGRKFDDCGGGVVLEPVCGGRAVAGLVVWYGAQ